MRLEHDLLTVLLLAVAREADRGESLERADVGGRAPTVVNAHLEHLAALGFVTTRRGFGQKYRTAALTAAGRA